MSGSYRRLFSRPDTIVNDLGVAGNLSILWRKPKATIVARRGLEGGKNGEAGQYRNIYLEMTHPEEDSSAEKEATAA